LGGDDLGGFLGIRGGSRSAAVDVGGEVVDFFTVFVGDFGAPRGARVGSEDDAAFECEADDCGSRFGGLGEVGVGGGGGGGVGLGLHLLDHGVAVEVVEGEAGRGGGGCT